jgi:hydrogenase-1 operon protein HyaE
MDMVQFAPPPTPPTRTGAVLIDKLLESGFPHLEADDIDLFIAPGGLRVIFVTGDPVKLLDSVDIAVVLPELCRSFAGKITPAVATRAAEPALASRFGADVRPALVFFASGQHLGTIPRVRDWDEYVSKITDFLTRAAELPAPTRQ